jgi:hypothetical protein
MNCIEYKMEHAKERSDRNKCLYHRNVVSAGAPSEKSAYRLNVSASYLVKQTHSHYITEIDVAQSVQ